ncbi:hypothetical protein E2C01_091195 [Portunus trituberculatus]|uniref:Uncharacterized protein n=1 Tax=Portunus trituberculatus TaxID=210409 RepID=A0A5B7JMX2_PORTR|nr:hypothetical protein [Portunus trituberculatus]
MRIRRGGRAEETKAKAEIVYEDSKREEDTWTPRGSRVRQDQGRVSGHREERAGMTCLRVTRVECLASQQPLSCGTRLPEQRASSPAVAMMQRPLLTLYLSKPRVG